MPWTSYPFSSRSSDRYEPSWPVMPVIRAFFGSVVAKRPTLVRLGVLAVARRGYPGRDGPDVE